MATTTSQNESHAVSHSELSCSSDNSATCKNNVDERTCNNDSKLDSWCLHRPKNKRVLGVWDEECSFQISLRYRDKPEDPLAVCLFSEVMPYHCLPTCGVYGLSDYHVALPLLVVMLPNHGLTNTSLLSKVFPKQLVHYFEQEPVKDPNKFDVSIVIHSRPYFEDSVDPSSRMVNVLFHMWALKDLPSAGQEEVHMTLEMGGFSPMGVVEIPPICEAEELNGLPLGRTGPRILYMHDMCFSPHNAQVQLTASHSLHALYTLCKQPSGHTALTYHIIPSTQEAEDGIKAVVRSSSNLETFLKHFRTFEEQLPTSTNSLLTHTIKKLLLLATNAL